MRLVFDWGKNPSTLPSKSNTPASPFPAGVAFSYFIDGAASQKNPATGTLVGFGQIADTDGAVYLAVYNVVKKDQKILTVADSFEVYVQYVATDGNKPQVWAS